MDVVIEAAPFPIAEPSLPKADPCVVVIFGALGDLATRMLVPALFRLAGPGCLSSRFKVLGVGRERINDEEYRERMRAGSKEAGDISDAEWRAFAGRLHYLQGDLHDVETYRLIARCLEQMTLQEGASENRLFYLSTRHGGQSPLATPDVHRDGAAGRVRRRRGARRESAGFPNYAAGGEGPAEADQLLARNGHRWRPIKDSLIGCEQ